MPGEGTLSAEVRLLLGMLLLSGMLHLWLLEGWPRPEQAPQLAGQQQLRISLQAARMSAPASPPAEANAQPGTTVVTAGPARPAPEKIAPPAAPAVKRSHPTAAPRLRPAAQAGNEAPPVLRRRSPPTDTAVAARPVEPAPAAQAVQPAAEAAAETGAAMPLETAAKVAPGTPSAPLYLAEPSFSEPPQAPVYPRQARHRGQQGEVLLAVWIDAAGAVAQVRVLHSSRFPLLDRAALQAVTRWRFTPARQDGRAVASYVKIPVRFRLDPRP